MPGGILVPLYIQEPRGSRHSLTLLTKGTARATRDASIAARENMVCKTPGFTRKASPPPLNAPFLASVLAQNVRSSFFPGGDTGLKNRDRRGRGGVTPKIFEHCAASDRLPARSSSPASSIHVTHLQLVGAFSSCSSNLLTGDFLGRENTFSFQISQPHSAQGFREDESTERHGQAHVFRGGGDAAGLQLQGRRVGGEEERCKCRHLTRAFLIPLLFRLPLV